MFKLVAAIFILVNGQLSEEPVQRMVNRTHFQTEEACRDHLSTPTGAIEKQALEEFAKAAGAAVKFLCEKEPDKETL